MIERAERRIFLSTLYIGSDESQLVESLSAALAKKQDLNLHLLLDFNRSTRPGDSTATLLLPLLEAYPDRVHISLFRSPKLKGIMAKLVPPRFNEGWGTWHAKVYGADDEVMISGANLNKSYFTNRKDRYIHFSGQTSSLLAQYCFDFMQTASTFSYRLGLRTQPLKGKHSFPQEGYTIQWPDAEVHPHRFNSKAAVALQKLQSEYRKGIPTETPQQNKVLLFPVIQGGQFGIREEESAMEQLFEKCIHPIKECSPVLDLTSGYFGLSKRYKELVLGLGTLSSRIVAASPLANGFYGSRFPSSRIPEGYTLLEQRFMKDVTRSRSNAELREWNKEGWTYHAKGLWLSPTPNDPPFLTLFGSTNLNSRSSNLDTELSFFMLAPPTSTDQGILDLRKRLQQEVEEIRKDTIPWKGEERKVRFGTKMLVALVGKML